MDDLRIGFVSLDVAAAPTEDTDAEILQNSPAKSLPTILIEDMSPDSQSLFKKEGSKNKVFIYLAANKQESGSNCLGLGATNPHIIEQLTEQVAAKINETGFLSDDQKTRLHKIVIQRYSADSASVHLLASNKRVLSALNIPLNITKSEDDEEKLEASSTNAHK